MENTNMNIPSVTVNKLVSLLQMLYTNAIASGTCLKNLATCFLWGPAGIGKSQAIEQFANKLGTSTGKRVNVVDIRLLLFSPIDLRGVPVADEHKRFTDWLMPRIFDMDGDDSCVNILFLDELSAAPVSVQAAAYQICLDRRIGEFKLPDNCIVIAAGNRVTDMSVSYKMPKALCNRLMHFNITTDYNSWKKWAVENGIDNRIIGYLGFDNSRLCVEPQSADLAYPTPRSWAFVDSLLKTASGDVASLRPLISACIGTDTAIEFETWVKSHKDLPNTDDVMAGRPTAYPKTYDALVAFTASLVAALRFRKDTVTVDQLENVCAYVSKFPTDFAMTFYTDVNAIETLRLKLMKCPSCKKWISANKKFM